MSVHDRKPPKTPARDPGGSSPGTWPNEGEGNKSADRRYREQTKQFVKSGRVKTQARKAANALDSSEGAQLAEAEKKGRRRGRS
jgi:hypothetical protein